MPYQTNGITTETVKNMMLDAGAVYINYGEADERLLGATSGGNTFTVERKVREIEIDGARGPVKGARRIVEHRATLSVNLLEMGRENLKLILTAADVSDVIDPNTQQKVADKIQPRDNIIDSDYVKNIALVAQLSGSGDPVVIILHNALADDKLEFKMEDQKEATPEVQFTAHYDPANMNQVPYEIRYPVVA